MSRSRNVTTATCSRVLGVIAAAAARGDRCPTNIDLAGTAGVALSAVPRALRQLADAGTIAIEGGAHRRVVTITATGARTAGEIVAPHWRRRSEIASHQVEIGA